MTRRPRPRVRQPRNRRRRQQTRSSWLIKLLLPVVLVGGFALASYIGYLDYTVREQFEGKRWAIPARVYASPAELYKGLPYSSKAFEDLLLQLHYRQDAQLAGEGGYFIKGPQVNVRTRAFHFGDTSQDSRSVSVSFVGGQIDRIVDTATGNDLPILRMDPVQIGSFYPTRKEDRILIKLEEAPPTLLQGLFSTEDRDFYHHFGLSPKGIARAMWANVKAGGMVQGGSTITQQLVKNFFLTPERSLTRKLNEALMSLILEYRYSKDEILEAYLNEIFLGQDGGSAVHGFGLASEFYFGQSLKTLNLHQVATLVALVRGPSYYDPRRNPERATDRRNLVLDAMVEEGYIKPEQADEAKRAPLGVAAVTHRSANRYPGFIDLVKRQLKQEYKEDDLTSEGLRIVTTLDSQVQDTLEQTIASKLQRLERNAKSRELETAVIVTRRDNGEIVAMAGGRDPSETGFNRALDAVRPIGSLIKPVVYLTALDYPDRYTITTPVSDTRLEIPAEAGKTWSPDNFDNQEHGVVPLYSALAHSYNMATVRIGMDIGLGRVANTLKSMGVSRPVELFPSFLLGASALTPLEVTQIYQTLAGDGFATPLRSIRAVNAADGHALQSYPFTVRQAVDPGATFITNTILQEVMRIGTGRSAYNYLPAQMNLVGKTGTTNQLRDSWFAGFSGDYLSVVWVGRDDNKSTGLTGGSGALQIWAELMRQVSKVPVQLVAPDTIEMKWVDMANGQLTAESCPGARLLPFAEGSGPSGYSECGGATPDGEGSWLNQLNPF
ncbi:MAG: penicillin-binding protein 1B [Methylomonas sp.]|nr:penicillin-binding protein 1B [Methylomonas sp.]PPD20495.1 MAG: penicillin-binding protein 1B [Methylomonas sp.]PPD26825.1 MAG: penicillin-binding protein 1B [Methylomonas sp.]PPD38689.1 MAG: penicillin-binding protein 1B [Methylomonas sp.]PPD40822.1 MAG: penicillin-binding protein 1B [Methylomonas sp.]